MQLLKYYPLFFLLRFSFFFLVGFYILVLPLDLYFLPTLTDSLKPIEAVICIILSIISFSECFRTVKKLWSVVNNAMPQKEEKEKEKELKIDEKQ